MTCARRLCPAGVRFEDGGFGQQQERNNWRVSGCCRLLCVRYESGRVRVPGLARQLALCVRDNLRNIAGKGCRIGRRRGGMGSDQLCALRRLLAAASLLRFFPVGSQLRVLFDESDPRDATNFSGFERKCRSGNRRAPHIHPASRQRGPRGGAYSVRDVRVSLVARPRWGSRYERLRIAGSATTRWPRPHPDDVTHTAAAGDDAAPSAPE
jgi:hypothetical protein